MGADAQIEQDAIGMKCRNGGEGGRGGKGRFEILDRFGAEPLARGGNRVGIAINSQNLSP